MEFKSVSEQCKIVSSHLQPRTELLRQFYIMLLLPAIPPCHQNKQILPLPTPPPIQYCLSLKTNAYNSCVTQDNIARGVGWRSAIHLKPFGILPRVTAKFRSFFKLSQVVLSRVVAENLPRKKFFLRCLTIERV